MKIKWFGQNSFQVIGNEVSVAIDPQTAEIETDIVIQTEDAEFKIEHEDLISWPGEYEMKDVIIHAAPVGVGKEEKKIVSFEVDGIRLCAMANVTETPATSLISELGDIDILFMPMTVKPKVALETIEEFDPRMVILSNFKAAEDDDLPLLGDFLKGIGQSGLEAEEKLEISSRASLDSENTVYKYLAL